MIVVIGTVLAKPECVEEALKISLEHVKRSRQEPGCLRHDVSVDADNAFRLIFVEYWRDKPALLAHFGVAGSKNFVRALTGFVVAPPEMKIFGAEEVSVG